MNNLLAATFGLILALLLSAMPSIAIADEAPQGYQPRMCGLDMNRNGIVGEPADCNVCDGVTADPDGDTIDEDIIYVSCPAGGPFTPGSDVAGCGTPGNPCASIAHAWRVLADGPADGAEDLICFRNICSETSIGPAAAGVAGTYIVPASGSDQRDWNYPDNPTMLVGWDVDNDGAYPPEDPDDLAVLDGSAFNAFDPGTIEDPTNIDSTRDPRNKNRTFELKEDNDFVEIAHFTVQKYGFESDKLNTGFIFFPTSGDVDYLYIHDLRVLDNNADHKDKFPATVISPPNPVPDPGEQIGISGSFVPTFNLFDGQVHWGNFTNLLIDSNTVWIARGVGNSVAPDEGPLRWKNITAIMDSCGEPDDPAEAIEGRCRRLETGAWKLWNYISGIEILDSTIDNGLAGKVLASSGNRTNSFGIIVAQCAQDWVVRNSTIVDFKIGLLVQASDDRGCRNVPPPDGLVPDGVVPRPVDNVVFDRNFIWSTHPWGFGTNVIQIENEDAQLPNQQLANLTLTNNIIYATRYDSCMFIHHDHPSEPVPGLVVIANNTCAGKPDRFGAISIGDVEQGSNLPFKADNFIIRNNLISGITGNDFNIMATYAPASIDMDFNVYNAGPVRRFQWAGTDVADLNGWQVLTGLDQNSRECTPDYVDPAGLDFHLSAGDGCARDNGTGDGVSVVTTDIDGDDRGQGAGWDVGADEVPAMTTISADLALSGRVLPISTTVGGTVRYLIMVTNFGPDPAMDSSISVSIPNGLSYVGDSCGGGAPAGSVWGWDVGTVPVNNGSRVRPRCLITLMATQAGTVPLATMATSSAEDPVPTNNALNANVTVN